MYPVADSTTMDSTLLKIGAQKMQTPLQITVRHMTHSAALDARIRELLDKLERIHDRIIGCRVVVDGPSGHPENGGVFAVRMALTIPGGIVNAVSARQKHGDAYTAVATAFASAKRQLTDLTHFRTHYMAAEKRGASELSGSWE